MRFSQHANRLCSRAVVKNMLALKGPKVASYPSVQKQRGFNQAFPSDLRKQRGFFQIFRKRVEKTTEK